MKRAIFAVAALLAVAALMHPGRSGGGAAVAATPVPTALQYDQITRFAVPPASPPPPGAFADDYQAIIAAAHSATPAPHHGFGGVLGAVMSGAMPDAAIAGAAGMMQTMRYGHLVRYTFYNGWIRTDDVVAQTATISKCDRHQYITLDLAKKTYTVADTQPACPTPSMPMARPAAHGQSAPPGTVDMNVEATQRDLGPMTIDTIATTGTDRRMQMTMTNATGSCHDGSIGMNVTQYASSIAVPRPYCPLPHTMGPSDMVSMHDGGGCKPTMHIKADITGMDFGENALGKLVLYSRMSFGGASGTPAADVATQQPNNMAMVSERGNVKTLSGADADALFAIPPGFTQAQ